MLSFSFPTHPSFPTIGELVVSLHLSCSQQHICASLCILLLAVYMWELWHGFALSLWFCVCRMCRSSAVVYAVRIAKLSLSIMYLWYVHDISRTKTSIRWVANCLFPLSFRGKNWLLRRRKMLTYIVDNGPNCWILNIFSYYICKAREHMVLINRSLKQHGYFWLLWMVVSWWLEDR